MRPSGIGYGIRQIGISLTNLTYEPDMQLSFFDDPQDDEKEKQMEAAMVDIRTRYMNEEVPSRGLSVSFFISLGFIMEISKQ